LRVTKLEQEGIIAAESTLLAGQLHTSHTPTNSNDSLLLNRRLTGIFFFGADPRRFTVSGGLFFCQTALVPMPNTDSYG
jgi:hypothetical protein